MATKNILVAIADAQAVVEIDQALGEEWLTTPVASEADALALLDAGSFDALLVDFNLGEPDASELLNQSLVKCPKMTRFMLAYEADLALIAAKVEGDHEILPQPLEMAALKSRIENSLASPKAGAVKPQNPSAGSTEDEISHVYAEVLQALESSTVSCRQIGAIIGHDAALTQEVLRLTRSAYLGLPGNITNPIEAVEVLGLETVKAVVMARRFLDEHRHLNSCYLSPDKLWQHSLNVAQIARDLVLFETRNRALASQALAAGLLHDLGKIVLATNFDDLYGRVHSLARKQPVALWDVEKEMFGANHGEIGACLLGMWNMSGDIVDAAAFHHEPPLGEHNQLTPLAAVHIANVLEHQLRPDNEFQVLPVVSTPFLNQLHLLQRLPVWRATFANQRSPEKPAQPADAPASQTGNQLPGPATATWTSTAAPENEPQRTASSTSRSQTRGRVYAGTIAAALLLAAALFRLKWSSDDSVSVNARTLEHAEPAVAGFPAPSLEPALAPAPEVAATTDLAPAAPTPTSDLASNALPEVVALEPAAVAAPPVIAEAAVTNAAPDTTASASVAPVKAEGPTFKLNGIFYGGSNPSAIVNGKAVAVGESVNGATVIRIGQSEVTLDLHGEHQIVRLPVR
ncbi:MAG TPA: HDOD domain-containing protein [Verrucomicrobiae bacterium]|nr:HDOD domain-containing protein [Verrucomicrobiae bacterium]